MPTSTVNLDWKAIRPLNGSRANGFEELCAQLARAESPTGSRFERKGSPDAGVECYVVLSDGSEWGWQAKFFDAFGELQWSQLDDSIKTALAKHPRLVRYFTCIPLDRPDARIGGRRSAKERWDEHVQKWANWAAARGMVERAIDLGADLQVDETLLRPPYKSQWRVIPSEDDIAPLLPDWSRGSHDSGDVEWSRNRIGSSVMGDDFARYVIGTNSSSTNWLSLRLDEPAWQSPEERLVRAPGKILGGRESWMGGIQSR